MIQGQGEGSAPPVTFIAECIDSVAPKQHLILAAHAAGIPIISSMGAGGRMDPSRVRVVDISQTYNGEDVHHHDEGGLSISALAQILCQNQVWQTDEVARPLLQDVNFCCIQKSLRAQ